MSLPLISLLFHSLLAALAISATAASAQPFAPEKEPAPDWVTPLERPAMNEARRAQTKDGLYYLLSDRQMKWEPGLYHQFRRVAVQAIDRSGLEDAGSLSIDFDPQYSQITLHSFKIIRDGKEIDKLAELKFEVLQRETDLERGVLDGYYTAYTHAQDVRVGDIVDYSYSKISKPKIQESQFSDGFATSWSIPVGVMRYRLLLPAGYKLSIKANGHDVERTVETSGDLTISTWLNIDPEPTPSQENKPSWRENWGSIDITTGATWQDISRDLSPLFDYGAPLTQPFEAKVDEIKRRYSDPFDRITEALRLVQDSIRYVGIEVGRGAYQPRPPMTVINSGFGDCKDKAQLLVAALRRLDLKAAVALAHLSKGRAVQDHLPSPYEFDHAIVRVTVNEKTLWLDPTLSHQGGRAPNIAAPDYGYVLPIVDGGVDLELIPLTLADEPTRDVIERYEFIKNSADAFTLVVNSKYSGDEADYWRRKLANQSLSELGLDYEKYYDGIYPGIRSTSAIKARDDRDRNIVTLSETYALDKKAFEAGDLMQEFRLRASSITGELKTPSLVKRAAPIALPFPLHARHRVLVVNPPLYTTPIESVTVAQDQFYGRLDSTSTPELLQIDWLLKVKAPEVPLKDAAEYNRLASQFDDSLYWTYNFTASDPEDQEVSKTDKTESSSSSPHQAIAGTVVPVAIIILIGLTVAGAVAGIRADQAYRMSAYFYPIGIPKFIVMSIATLGLYIIFWSWKFWLWEKQKNDRNVIPFLRGIFYPLFIYSAIKTANAHLEDDRKLPLWTAILIMVFAIAAWAIGAIPDLYAENSAIDLIVTFATVGVLTLCTIPLVILVNRINGQDSEALIWNSQYSGLNNAGVVAGVAIILFLVHQTLA